MINAPTPSVEESRVSRVNPRVNKLNQGNELLLEH
jgi:hypothetical protein